MNEFMKMAVDQVIESFDDTRSTFEKAVDDAAATYGVDQRALVQAVNLALSDCGGEGAFRTT